MFNRAEIIDQNFSRFVQGTQLPPARSTTTPQDAGLSPEQFLDLFESQMISRHLDLQARLLKNQNLCFYTIGSSGHEGNAGLGRVFRYTDMAFLHYRSCALMIQRAKQFPGSTPIYDNLLSFMASSDDPIAGGRHKVFGSKPLFVPPQTSTIASHLPKAIGAALSIARAKDLKLTDTELLPDSVVLCSFGDASINHSTAVGAINTACLISYQHMNLPLVFICEDNGIGISVPTPGSWVADQYSERRGLKYFSCDSLNLCDVVAKAKLAESYVRLRRRPVFFHFKTVRLLGHAGSDVESTYKALKQIELDEFNDPLLHSARIAIENQYLSPSQILDLYESLRRQVAAVTKEALCRPKLLEPEAVSSSITACASPRRSPDLTAKDGTPSQGQWHLAKLINFALNEILERYPTALVFGEDVAAKGGVYNVTDGLLKRFGPKRVFNSPLDEQSIIGTAIGMAHNGFLPIPEIQFLAYVHNAEDQIRGEAATLAFFSQGQFTNPMILRVAGLPYQKGFGGHFHNDNSLAVFRDIPGLIIAVPSNGLDAVKMLRAVAKEAYERGRVVVFVEPIALYMTKDLHQAGDKLWTSSYPSDPEDIIAPGDFGVFQSSPERPPDLAIVTYGNGYYLSRQAEKVLSQEHSLNVKIIDLRWVAPLNKAKLCEELREIQKVLIVDECRKTGSLSEGIVTLLVEGLKPLPQIAVEAAHDCFITLGVAAAAGLPSRESIIKAALKLNESPDIGVDL